MHGSNSLSGQNTQSSPLATVTVRRQPNVISMRYAALGLHVNAREARYACPSGRRDLVRTTGLTARQLSTQRGAQAPHNLKGLTTLGYELDRLIHELDRNAEAIEGLKADRRTIKAHLRTLRAEARIERAIVRDIS